MSASDARPVQLLCASAVVAIGLLLWAQRQAGDLARAASAFPKSQLAIVTRLGVSPTAISSPGRAPSEESA